MTISRDLTSPESVRAVAEVADDTLRNLKITQSYHELALALDPFVGRDLSWPAFATYASKQAGQVIRGDVVPEPLRALALPPRLATMQWLRPTTWLRSKPWLRYLQLTVGDVGGHIADGNRLVYERLAPLFAGFAALCQRHHPEPPAAAEVEALVADLRAAEVGDELPRAFEVYAASMRLEGKARAEAVLLANVLIGWHEQQRLQPPIRAALDAPVARALEDPKRLLFPKLPVPRVVRWPIARLFRVLFRPAIRAFEAKARSMITQCFMTLSVPAGELGLGDDIPRLRRDRDFPADLLELDNEELHAVLARFDATPDSLRRTAARDWSVLAQRMHYIADFFRSRQRDRTLLEPPFSPHQVPQIYAGQLPPGRL